MRNFTTFHRLYKTNVIFLQSSREAGIIKIFFIEEIIKNTQ